MTQTYSDPGETGCEIDRKTTVRSEATRTAELPIYESLIRERGDVVEEARAVAEKTQQQMSQALAGHAPAPTEPGEH
ncbi:hypothetical protein ACWDQ0_24630 [Streptomyces sp. NPDC003642]